MQQKVVFHGLLVLCLLLGATTATAAGPPVTRMEIAAAGIEWIPQIDDYESLLLTVSGPDDFFFSQSFGPEVAPNLSAFAPSGASLPDGAYSWELTVIPRLDVATRRALSEAREAGDTGGEAALAGALPKARKQSGFFSVLGGELLSPTREETPAHQVAQRDQEIAHRVVLTNGDGVIRNSLCVGFDCPDAPAFSDTTILMMENNTRIKFDDTSALGGFPANDWEIEANSASSGGANYLGFNDCGSSAQGGCVDDLVFAVEAGARSSALYVESDGDVGIGTSNPVLDVHLVTGNSPSLRLEQDGSSGFAPQTWDIAGNEANFFIRDVTGGSRLPFRIRPGAPTSSIDIAASGNVGIRTAAPADFVDIAISGSTGGLTIGSTTDGILPRLTLIEPTRTWRFQVSNNGAFNFVDATGGGNTPFLIAVGANNGLLAIGADNAFSPVANRVTVNGQLFVGATQLSVPDYVFEPDYPLMPLPELRAFIAENGHLPKVESAAEVENQGGINLTQMPLTLLEKVEELTLYVLTQQDHIDRLNQDLGSKEALIADLVERLNQDGASKDALIAELSERLAKLERRSGGTM